MSYIVMARKYRPETFDHIVGQKAITMTLKNAIAGDRIAHAYLFSGPHGVGKTSMARILAKCLNCEKGPTPAPCLECDACARIAQGQDVDVIEIDGASKRKIEDIKEIIQNVVYTPTRSRNKIYIIDEVHMLTKEAFNALLKTLEEPPAHVKFIFATTDPEKVPETIRSRCQQFQFGQVALMDVVERLHTICRAEGIDADPGALETLARNAAGALRDAQSILDQLAGMGKGKRITRQDVTALFGLLGNDELDNMIKLLGAHDDAAVLLALDGMIAKGMRPVVIADQLASAFRDLFAASTAQCDAILHELPEDRRIVLREMSNLFSREAHLLSVQILVDAAGRMKKGLDDRILLELALMRIMRSGDVLSLSQVLSRLEALPSLSRHPNGTMSSVTMQRAGDMPRQAGASHSPDAASEPPKRGSSESDLAAVWRRIIEEVKSQSNKQFTAALLRDAAPLELNDRVFRVGFMPEYRFHRDQLDTPDKRRMIEVAIKNVTGRGVNLEFCTLNQEGAIQADQVPASEKTIAITRKADGDALGQMHPLVRHALRIFDGRAVSVVDNPAG